MVSLTDRAGVLGQLWMNYRDDKDFSEFIEYNDIGLPMAYFLAEGLVKELTPLGEQYIIETFDLFSTQLGLTEESYNLITEDVNLGSILALSFLLRNKDEDPLAE